MVHLETTVVILVSIIAFATGYYLCLKNVRPKQTFKNHGLEEERVQPRPDPEKTKDL